MKRIVVMALDGVMDSSLAITLDTLRAAQAFGARGARGERVCVDVIGHTRKVTTGGGLQLQTDRTFKEARTGKFDADWIILPALGLVTDEAITQRLAQRDSVMAMKLLNEVPTSIPIATSCSSVFLLAATGLLTGREVTTTWWLAHLFRARHPEVVLDETKMLIRDGRYLTAGSAYSQLDLMMAIVVDVMGSAVAELCSRYLLIDQRPSQARYMVHSHRQHVDPTVIAAERWIDAHLSEPIAVTDLANQLSVTPRTLARRIEAATGVSPVKFIQRRRLLHASHLIETTPMSIEAVAAKVGYQDGTALRKLVKREFGTTPAGLRS